MIWDFPFREYHFSEGLKSHLTELPSQEVPHLPYVFGETGLSLSERPNERMNK